MRTSARRGGHRRDGRRHRPLSGGPRIDPEAARAHFFVGLALAGRGRLDKVNDRRRETLRIDPEAARARDIIFGEALNEGFGHLEQLQRIDPEFRVSYNNLGLTPRDAGRLNEAVDHFKQAFRMDLGSDPSLYGRVPAVLGQACLAVGRFRDAEAATRRCLDRLPGMMYSAPTWKPSSDGADGWSPWWTGSPRSSKARNGPATRPSPSSSPNSAACRVDSPRPQAFTPTLSRSLRPDRPAPAAPRRYTAACALRWPAAVAARAGHAWRGGSGSLASAAHEWLRADLAGWARTLESGPESGRLLVRRRLAHLWADPDLAAPVRPRSTGKTPPGRGAECRTLWGEVDALICRAQAP